MEFDLTATSTDDTYRLLTTLIAPRPIAWVTTVSEKGHVNAAPFSAFNYLSSDPPILGLGIGPRVGAQPSLKDTARNIQRTKQFVVNVVTQDLLEHMRICATDFPEGVSEIEAARLTTLPSTRVEVPRIEQAHAALECREHSTIEVGRSRIILAEVLVVQVNDRYINESGPPIKGEDLALVGATNSSKRYVQMYPQVHLSPSSQPG